MEIKELLEKVKTGEMELSRAEEILKTPLEKFGDQEIEDLADKYENQDLS